MGLYSLGQALCYAELALVIPKTGGDHTYIYEILGELPAFIVAWGQIFIAMMSSNAAVALTASVYLWKPLTDPWVGALPVHPPPPQWDPILSYSHTFLPKSACIRGWHPPMAQCPPNGKSWIHHWKPLRMDCQTSALLGRDRLWE